ncbi:MAG: glycoside hydrolase family 2 TIM barrel-domain containing protein, partial [Bacteroidota bacterium]
SYVDAFKIEDKSTFDAKLFRLHKNIANNKPVFYFNIDEGKCFSYALDINSSIYCSIKGYHADLKTQNSNENITSKSGFQPFEIFNDFFHLIEPEFETEIKSTKHIKIFRKDKLGNFNFLVDNKRFVIKGVAYNLSHDWRDGPNYPSREQLNSDFKLISQMGATVVRRYASDIYDDNILNVAKDFNLKVQFGFWFDPKVDYSKDSTRLNQYYNEVESTVKKWKGHPSVLMWSLGNECWGQLKHHFGKPYLIEVRSAYLAMIERMARMIHEIDSVHPVATCIEHEETQLPSELVNLRLDAPSLDAIGINSYYQGQISKLDSVFLANDTTRPYFISEFGPEGYWNDHYNKISKSRINEQSSLEKADWYAYQWRNYIEKNSGRCLGGVAYCWQDRMEGSYTWFGITDYKNRLKPAYWSIKNIWSTISENEKPNFIYPQIASFSMGNYKIFSIKNLNDFGKEIKVEWKILKQEYLYPYSDYKLINNGYSICVVIPKEEEYLRVYLYLYDESNNVITSSLPVYFESISGDPPPLMASSP